MNAIYDPFEPTPNGFHQRVAQKLNELQRAHQPVPRTRGRVAVLAVCLVLLCGTALALRQFGVLDFLTARIEGGAEITAENIVTPKSQSCDSQLLSVSAQDAYWDGHTLSVSINVKPASDSYAFYTETDVGTDGEHFDHIWWNGEILPLDEWLAGRQAIRLDLPAMILNGAPARHASWDWVENEQGKTLLVQAASEDMTHETVLHIQLHSIIVGSDTAEQATLTVTLPPMSKEDDSK